MSLVSVARIGRRQRIPSPWSGRRLCWWLEIDGLFGYAACAFPSMGTLSRLDVG